MPLYEYECTKCGHRFELIQKFSDPPVEKCPRCKAPVRKLLSAPAIQFKGTGWYVTDYGKKDGGSEKKNDTSGTKSGDSGAKSGTKDGGEKK